MSSRFIDIVANGLDAGIRLYEDIPRDMIAIPFHSDIQFIIVAAPSYLTRHSKPLSSDELKKHNCIRFRFESGAINKWELHHQNKIIYPDISGSLILGSWNLVAEAALAGLGIAYLPRYYVDDHLITGQLLHLLPQYQSKYSKLCLYYPANRYPPTALHLLIQAIKNWVKIN